MSRIGLEKDLVRVCLSPLYLIITTAIYGVDLVFRTLVSNIFWGQSLGVSGWIWTSGWQMCPWSTCSMFLHPFPCPGVRLEFWFQLVQVLEEGLIVCAARNVEFMVRAGGVRIRLCLALSSCYSFVQFVHQYDHYFDACIKCTGCNFPVITMVRFIHLMCCSL